MLAKNTSSLNGQVLCPGDKSISQRSVIIGSLINKEITISGFLHGDDPISTLNALNTIGANISIEDGDVKLSNREIPFKTPLAPISLDNSGTGMRLMMGLISGLGLEAELIGDNSLMKRPMKRVSIPLNKMGADIKTIDGLPPVHIIAKTLNDNFVYEMPIASAQVKSAIILAGVASNKKVSVFEPAITRDHTEIMLEYFGLNIESKEIDGGKQITFIPGSSFQQKNYDVVGDFSSASFLIVAGLIAKNSTITIKNVGLNPSRCGLISILKEMGANIEVSSKIFKCGEKAGDLIVKSSQLKGINIGGDIIPNIIDEIPILSIAAACAEGITKISDAKELRVKESDRLEAISEGLNALNVKYSLYDDGISITGGIPETDDLIEIDSFGDHRIAMSFLISSLKIGGGVCVKDCKNIYTSYPNFIQTMNDLGMEISE